MLNGLIGLAGLLKEPPASAPLLKLPPLAVTVAQGLRVAVDALERYIAAWLAEASAHRTWDAAPHVFWV